MDALARQLEGEAGSQVDLLQVEEASELQADTEEGPVCSPAFMGLWQLIYSSAFNTGTGIETELLQGCESGWAMSQERRSMTQHLEKKRCVPFPRLPTNARCSAGNLGGSRPGPPAGLLPVTLGQIYQRIDRAGHLDNIVELLLPQLPLLAQPADSPGARLTLRHSFEIQGRSTVQIVYDDTSVQLFGVGFLDGVPELFLPSLPEPFRPPKFIR